MKFSIHTIQTYINEPLPTPAELEHLFTFRLCEVEGLDELPDGDVLIDLNILPNRAHDMLSHYGVARELAGQLGLTLMPLFSGAPHSSVASEQGDERLEVGVEIKTNNCKRYMARRIDGVTVGGSADEIRSFLAKFGQRSINNIVDATNQVMWLTGQPTHVFDADKITGGITVRQARTGEIITLLDGNEITLDESIMVIADDVAALAIAGIKGGKHAEVDVNTKNIILEVANFDASTIRKTAQKLGLRTDASYRFERDISPSVCDGAMAMLTSCVIASSQREVQEGSLTDIYPAPQVSTVIEFNLHDIASVAGAFISNADVTSILQRYGFPYVEREDNFSITAPLWRLDLTGRHDMIEEIIRIRGIEAIEPIAPLGLPPEENKLEELMAYIRKHLLSIGYNETMTYTFTSAGESSVLASTGDKSFLRTNLYQGFTEALIRNYRNRDLLGVDSISQFEMGTVFDAVQECMYLVIGRHAAKQKGLHEQMWKDLSDMLYGLGLTEIAINESVVYKDDFVFEVNLSKIVGLITKKLVSEPVVLSGSNVVRFAEWSKYPYITRDIAVWAPEDTAPDSLRSVYADAAGSLLVRAPRLVDQFTKTDAEGLTRTSYAFRLVFQSFDHTLTDAEIEPIMQLVTSAAIGQGWEVR